eukprot:s3494_g8.t1
MAKTKASQMAKSPSSKSAAAPKRLLAKSKAESKGKAAPKATTRKRKAPENPFEGAPDAGQASILNFASSRPAREEEPTDANVVEPVAVETTDATTAPAAVESNEIGETDATAAPAGAEPSAAETTCTTSDPVDFEPSQAGEVMQVEDLPETPALALTEETPKNVGPFETLTGDPNIQLGSVVEVACEVARSNTDMKSWGAMVHDFLQTLVEDQFSRLTAEGKCHPLVNAHIKDTKVKFQLDDEWVFLDDEGDQLEDLTEFVVWLVQHRDHQSSEVT